MIETKEEREAINLLMNPPVKVLQSRMNFDAGMEVSFNPTNHGFVHPAYAKRGVNKRGVIETLYRHTCRVCWHSTGSLQTVKYSQLIIID